MQIAKHSEHDPSPPSSSRDNTVVNYPTGAKWLAKDNFVAFLSGKDYDPLLLKAEIQQTMSLALRKNRFPPPAFGHMPDLVGEMFAALRTKPPNLNGEEWFIELYRLARRTASKYFRRLAPKEERTSDPTGYVIAGTPEESEGLYIERNADIPESYETYIDSLDLDIDIEEHVYRVMDERMFNIDPHTMDLSLRRVVLFACMM